MLKPVFGPLELLGATQLLGTCEVFEVSRVLRSQEGTGVSDIPNPCDILGISEILGLLGVLWP